MRQLHARTVKAGPFIAAFFSMLLSATPALAQTVTAMWNPSSQATGYQACIGTSSMACNVAFATVAAPATSYTFTPISGVRQYVAIRAINLAGASSFSSEVDFSIPSFAQPATQASVAGVAITPLSLSITDPDGSPITITHTGLPVGLSVNSATRQITGTPAAAGSYNVTLFVNDGLVTVSRSLTWTVTGGPVTIDNAMRPAADFDGDGRVDMWRYELAYSAGTWRFRSSSTGIYSSYQWGASGDIPVPADYDGDRRADIAVYRPSTGQWFILTSSTNYTYSAALIYGWGLKGDMPLPADFDGDGRAELTVFRPSSGYWFILKSNTNYTSAVSYAWGSTGDIPVPADYDGDRRADVAVFRPSTGYWFILKSSTNYTAGVSSAWGSSGDIPVPADYDGDGRADVTVYRPSNAYWFILKSNSEYTAGVSYVWGSSGDVPVPADYDGDRRADIAVWRASEYLFTSSRNFTAWLSYQWWH